MSISLLETMAQSEKSRAKLVELGLIQELLQHNLHSGTVESRRGARRLISILVKSSVEATDQLTALIRSRVMFALENYTYCCFFISTNFNRTMDVGKLVRTELELLSEICRSTDGPCWEKCFRLVMDLLLHRCL